MSSDSYLLGASLLGLVVRLLPRIVVPATLSQDAFFHLAMLRTIRSDGWRSASRKLVGYPLGFHIILSHVPSRLLGTLERFGGVFWDVLQTALFVLMLKYAGPSHSNTNAVLGALLVFIAPAWLYVGLGPRAYHLTERIFGELASTVVMCTLWLYSISGNVLWLAGALLAGAILLNSSKFSAQVLFAFCAMLAILRRDALFVAIPIGAAALALLMSGGAYWVILREQVRHLAHYRRVVRDGTAPVAQRNSVRRAYALWKEQGLDAAVRYVLLHHSLIIGVLQHPALVLVAAWALRHGTAAVPDLPLQWLLAAISCWLLTSAPFGLFLGEAERYLTHAVIPEYFIFVLFVMPAWPSAGWWMLAYSLCWSIAQILLLQRIDSKYAPREPARRELVAFLRTLRRMRFVTFGDSIMWDLAYETDHEHFLLSSSKYVEWGEWFSKYPFTRWSGVRKQKCDLLVLERASIERARLDGVACDYPLDSCALLYENERFMVRRLPASPSD